MKISRNTLLILLLSPPPTLSFLQNNSRQHTLHPHHQLHLTSKSPNNSNNNNDNEKNQKLTSSEREKRAEEKRRRSRSKDVVIGQTSAKPDAQNLPLDPAKTEKQLLDSYLPNDIERQIHVYTERGMECFKMLQLEEAREAFDTVLRLKPDAYVMHAGVTLFYLNEVHRAAEVFAKCAVLFENRFGCPASEERIWRDACELKLMNSLGSKKLKSKQKDYLPVIPDWGEGGGDGVNVEPLDVAETRSVVRDAMNLFDSSVVNDQPRTILSRAHLKSSAIAKERYDNRMWKMLSWYYLGLHHDAMNEKDQSKICMKNAIRLTKGGLNSGDITQCLPVIHMSRREWYDDEEFEEVAEVVDSGMTIDAMITEGVKKMTVVELKAALKLRGVKSGTKPKAELVELMTQSLLQESGMNMFPGLNEFQ